MKQRSRALLALASMAIFLATCAWLGMTRVPTDAQLLDSLAKSESHVTQCRAWNALAQRGYWIDRDPRAARVALDQSGAELRAFVRSAWPRLLPRSRRR